MTGLIARPFFLLLFLSVHYMCAISLQPYEQWWHNYVSAYPKLSYQLYGGINAQSRIVFRRYLKTRNYRSLLDIPCGFCTEYYGLQQDHIPINYYGIDIAAYLVEQAQQQGLSVIQGSIENIPYPDTFFDLCYARHIFEHVHYYEQGINELIRVAQHEVVVIFSLKPCNSADIIKLFSGSFYYNCYNKNKLESFIVSHPRVSYCIWKNINIHEIMLHIYLGKKKEP